MRVRGYQPRPRATAAIPHPRETTSLVRPSPRPSSALLAAYRGGAHAARLADRRRRGGIGKATLAYRMARFVLAHPDPKIARRAAGDVVRASQPIIRRRGRRRAGRMAGCWCWSAALNEKTGETVHRDHASTQVRESDRRFFGSTAAARAAGGSASSTPIEELNPQRRQRAAEDRSRSRRSGALLLLVTHAPGAGAADHPVALPQLMPAAARRDDEVGAGGSRRRLGEAGRSPTKFAPRLPRPAASVRRALMLLGGRRAGAAADARRCSAPARRSIPRALHALGDEIAGLDIEPLAAFMDTVNSWLGDRLAHRRSGPAAYGYRVWASVNKAGRETEGYNLMQALRVLGVRQAR